MALINDFNAAGDGRVTSKNKNIRRYRVGEADDFIDYVETTINETREWVGLTQAAAESQVNSNQQPAENGVNWSWSATVENKIIGSYRLERNEESKTTEVAGTSPPPTIADVTWSAASQTVTSFPFSVTISSSNADDEIWYRIDAMDSSGNYVSGVFTDANSNSVTISANSIILAAGYQGKHKVVRVVAESRRTALTGTEYVGPRSERVFTQEAPSMVNPTIQNGRTAINDFVDFENVAPSNDLGVVTLQHSGPGDLIYSYESVENPDVPSIQPGATWPYERFYVPAYSSSSFVNLGNGSSYSITLSTPTTPNPRSPKFCVRLSNSTVSGSGLRLAFVIRVQAYSSLTVDGIEYKSWLIKKWFHCKSNIWS